MAASSTITAATPSSFFFSQPPSCGVVHLVNKDVIQGRLHSGNSNPSVQITNENRVCITCLNDPDYSVEFTLPRQKKSSSLIGEILFSIPDTKGFLGSGTIQLWGKIFEKERLLRLDCKNNLAFWIEFQWPFPCFPLEN